MRHRRRARGGIDFPLCLRSGGLQEAHAPLVDFFNGDGAIKAGFASLKDGRDYGALFASALCRAKADWLIGINATRLFSCLYGKTLNVGRVQTPTLKMLTDRDAAISHFQKEKYYHVRLDLSGADAASEGFRTRQKPTR